ncbi:hypothetical protein [Streptomyces sp. NBC_01013]|uniref:hypothetical protein n=1 Tax=Streptomyces sp. NBC_01013 TaxID=2903718 RepID=UPI00386860AD|nr:hypothetical protein OG538_00200 [Streptomyces sp. NBC_01013]
MRPLLNGQLAEIPWIHRDHTHHPFNEHTWNHIRTTITHCTGHDSELPRSRRRRRPRPAHAPHHAGTATRVERHLLARTASTHAMPAGPHEPGRQSGPDPDTGRTEPATDHDSLDELDDSPDETTIEDNGADSHAPHTGYGLYDTATEALKS